MEVRSCSDHADPSNMPAQGTHVLLRMVMHKVHG